MIEASFLIDNYPLKEFFDDAELDYESETILRREIIPSGKLGLLLMIHLYP